MLLFFSVAHRTLLLSIWSQPHIVLGHVKRKNNWIVVNISPRIVDRLLQSERERTKKKNKNIWLMIYVWITRGIFWNIFALRVNGLEWELWRWFFFCLNVRWQKFLYTSHKMFTSLKGFSMRVTLWGGFWRLELLMRLKSRCITMWNWVNIYAKVWIICLWICIWRWSQSCCDF